MKIVKKLLFLFITGLIVYILYMGAAWLISSIPFLGAVFNRFDEETNQFGSVLIDSYVQFVILAVMFPVIFAFVCAKNPDNMDSFYKDSVNGHKKFECMLLHMKKDGKVNVIMFAVYSLPIMIFMMAAEKTEWPPGSFEWFIRQVWFCQSLFYRFLETPVISRVLPVLCFIMSVAFFTAVYAAAVVFIHIGWYARSGRKKIK